MNVTMSGIYKAFGPVRVLESVDLAVKGGEIHALMGENGAGKSTLMKILSGVYTPDAGMIHIDAKPVQIRSTTEAENHGIAIIHQELNLINPLSVMENLFLGREHLYTHLGVINRKRMRQAAHKILAHLGSEQIDPDREAGSLSIGQQQMVEIAKALALNAKVLIMDEPTAALTDREIDTLFDCMLSLKQQGVAIIYVSHRMEEIFKICDKISILRDGQLVCERAIPDTHFDEVVHMMVGRALEERFPKRQANLGSVRLQVDCLAADQKVRDISFSVKAGEVLGIAGLMGAGRSEILNALFGSKPAISGGIQIDGKALTIKQPGDAIKAGMAYVTEDRKRQGLVLGMSLRKNATLVHLRKFAHLGWINRRAEQKTVNKLIDLLRIRTRDSELAVRSLSGGNQQKVVFAKWLITIPKVLLLDEPTRGVDVGGKAEIYHIINRLAKEGVAIVMISSELPEVMAMSDRIMVIHEGRQAGIFEAATVTQEEIMTAATGGHH